MSKLPDPLDSRIADHPIEPLFLKRWSPRAMSGEAVANEDLLRLLEAARWAPSTYNVQEWRFLYAHRDGAHWRRMFALLAEPNQVWCRNAGALLLVSSCKTFEHNGKPNPVYTFDAGLACQNLLLQAAAMGLVAHAMAGFDRDAARRELQLPPDVDPHAMVAVGHPGDPAELPEELQAKDRAPSQRKPLSAIACEGPYCFG